MHQRGVPCKRAPPAWYTTDMTPYNRGSLSCGDIAERLRQQGYRLTPQRLAVIDIVAGVGEHLTAEEIFAEVQAAHPYTNIATIYRTLQWLQQVGLVAPLIVSGEPVRYEFTATTRHHHLICLACGGQQQIGDEILDQLKAHLLACYSFTAQLHHLGLTGYCASCRPAAECALQE